MTICPCCGFKSNGDWNDACASCGSRPVGEPLPRPQHELPSYGRSLVLALTGTLMVLVLLVQTFSSFAQRLPTYQTSRQTFYAAGVAALDLGAWLTAAQMAAWRLKWVTIPMIVVVLWFCRKLFKSIKTSPSQFCGLRAARRGYLAAGAVPLVILVLIGVTVPERLRRHQWSVEAETLANGYRIDRALNEYVKEFETLPSHVNDLKRLPDADGSLAAALGTVDESGYKPSADLAAAPSKKPRPLRGAMILNASTDADDVPTEHISFTNYELLMPGADKVLGTEDDLIVRDGLIQKASEAPRRLGSTTGVKQTGKR